MGPGIAACILNMATAHASGYLFPHRVRCASTSLRMTGVPLVNMDKDLSLTPSE